MDNVNKNIEKLKVQPNSVKNSFLHDAIIENLTESINKKDANLEEDFENNQENHSKFKNLYILNQNKSIEFNTNCYESSKSNQAGQAGQFLNNNLVEEQKIRNY